jgi:hypothetical protein|nr:MAG TPA: hypothetical protein [Caudoviricetes sp.]
MDIFQEGIIDNIKDAFMRTLNFAIISEPEYRQTTREPYPIANSIVDALKATKELGYPTGVLYGYDEEKNKTTFKMSKERWNYLKDVKVIILVANPNNKNIIQTPNAPQGPALGMNPIQTPPNPAATSTPAPVADKRYVSTFKELVDECDIKIEYIETDEPTKERMEAIKPFCDAYKKLLSDKYIKNYISMKIGSNVDAFIFGYDDSLKIGKFDLSSVFNNEDEYKKQYQLIQDALTAINGANNSNFCLKIEEVEDWNGSIVLTKSHIAAAVVSDPETGEEEVEVVEEPKTAEDTDGPSNTTTPGEVPQNTTEKVLDNANNENAAVASAMVGMNTPFITVHTNYLAPPTFAVSNDISTKRSITVDAKDNKLKLVDNSPEVKTRVFKYVGKNKGTLKKITDNLGQTVGKDYIYETVTGRKYLVEDQIFYDEDFQEIDLEAIKEEVENDKHTIMNKVYMALHDGLPIGEEVTTNEAKRMATDLDDIYIFETANGYYAMNSKTMRSTKLYNTITGIKITEDLINGKF